MHNPKVSKRESEVLNLIAMEYTCFEISDLLHLSHNTIKTHKKNLFTKLDAKNAAGLIRRAFELRLLRVD